MGIDSRLKQVGALCERADLLTYAGDDNVDLVAWHGETAQVFTR